MPAIPLSALLRALLIWAVFILAETLQGALRRALFGPQVELWIKQASVFTGVVLIFVVAWLFRRWLAAHSVAGALAVGALWVAMTLGFEVGLGRLLGLGWPAIGADYDLARGGLMPLGLLAMALTPLVVRGLARR